ncbi:MAG TPA: polymer-forming cytoskeletal protein [Caulobacteraceae bacterium]|nr:polymer-forming cytoskeletal protein [Caulobacteraceae bacterium]
MFSKPNPQPQPAPTPTTPAPTPAPSTAQPAVDASAAQRRSPGKGASLIAGDVTIEGNVTAGGELQIDGTVKGDIRVERVTVGDSGTVEGGIFAEAVEVRGRVSGAITAKQVRLYGACHVDGDITHEQLAMETGAFFQGRSLRLQRAPLASPSASTSTSARSSEPPTPAKEGGNGSSKSATISPRP